MHFYHELVKRNLGYITTEEQEKISKCKVLIAGCGVGSAIVISATRMGFQHYVLVDNDTIETHNLNRQSYQVNQLGKSKVEALKENILAINPEAKVEIHNNKLDQNNASALVQSCDLIFDTIDFLDLSAIVALHDQAHIQKKMLISLFSAGAGAVAYISPPSDEKKSYIREVLNLPDGTLEGESYVDYFMQFFGSLAPKLNPNVVKAMTHVFSEMKDNRPCPAPHLSIGAESVACLGITAALEFIRAKELKRSMITIDLEAIVRSQI